MCEATVTLPLHQFDEMRREIKRSNEFFNSLSKAIDQCVEIKWGNWEDILTTMTIDQDQVCKFFIQRHVAFESEDWNEDDIKIIWKQKEDNNPNPHTKVPKCPYCGDLQDDDHEFNPWDKTENIMECYNCGEEFEYVTHTTHTFSSYPKQKEAPTA